MIEPTETESKETLDAFVEALREIVATAKSNPAELFAAPVNTVVARRRLADGALERSQVELVKGSLGDHIGNIAAVGLRIVADEVLDTGANAAFLDDIGQYFNAIVPVGYDPAKPVGTGAFMYASFTPGQQSVFKKFPNYWQHGKPYADQLTIIDFTDDTARVNALLGGQVDAIDNLPTGQIAQVQGSSSLKVLISHTGQWQPFTMRIDQAPFNDVRVRQAMRLIVNRPQMVEQVLSGQGRVANDMYSPFDPAYDSSLPQRSQDIAQAKSLLKSAGHAGLSVQLVTAPVFQGVVQAAQVFAQQASAAGVKVNLRKLDTGTFYGPNYLKWTFAQDFWATREYLPQVAQGSLPSSPFNETHWGAGAFEKLINQARAELDATKRTAILREAEKMEYDQGGYIIPYFSNQIDAYSSKLGGFVEAKSGFPLGNYWFKNVGFTA